MSYEKVKSINVKKMEIISADSSIRPLTFRKWKMKAENEEDFIKKCLVAFLDGDMHPASNNVFKIVYVVHKFETTHPQAQDIYNKRWNNYDWKTKQYKYTKEEIDQAQEDVRNILYEMYKNTTFTKGQYVINYGASAYVCSIGENKMRYCYGKENGKVFDSLEKAEYTIEAKLTRFNKIGWFRLELLK